LKVDRHIDGDADVLAGVDRPFLRSVAIPRKFGGRKMEPVYQCTCLHWCATTRV